MIHVHVVREKNIRIAVESSIKQEKIEFKKGSKFVVCQPINKNVDKIH